MKTKTFSLRLRSLVQVPPVSISFFFENNFYLYLGDKCHLKLKLDL